MRKMRRFFSGLNNKELNTEEINTLTKTRKPIALHSISVYIMLQTYINLIPYIHHGLA